MHWHHVNVPAHAMYHPFRLPLPHHPHYPTKPHQMADYFDEKFALHACFIKTAAAAIPVQAGRNPS